MLKYGTSKTTHALDDKGSAVVKIDKVRNEVVDKAMTHYRIRVKISGSQDEMTEYIRFTDELAKLRKSGKLTQDREDPTTRPMFIIDYPRESVDGGYFIIKCWTVLS